MLLSDVRHWLSRAAAAPAPAPHAPARARATQAAPAEPEPPWSRRRLALTHQLWGDGFILPGGSEEVLRLAAPLGLSAASSLLLLGCGAGGPARAVATLLGAWVAGYEADPDLAAEATAVCARANLGKRVRIDQWNPAAPAFPAHSCHHVLALDPFRAGAVAPLLEALAGAIRPGGQITLLATVADEGFDPAGEDARAWLRLDGRAAPPPGRAAIARAFTDRRFDLRVTEDLSAPHMRDAVQAWRGLVHALRDGNERPPRPQAEALVREAELWLRQVRLMRGGQLRWIRWHAIARPG